MLGLRNTPPTLLLVDSNNIVHGIKGKVPVSTTCKEFLRTVPVARKEKKTIKVGEKVVVWTNGKKSFAYSKAHARIAAVKRIAFFNFFEFGGESSITMIRGDIVRYNADCPEFENSPDIKTACNKLKEHWKFRSFII